ncbi:MAG: hypothetical protein M3R36_02920 [Bacteroidota bacterium]|nr:hypothetical protein [Bacteroidota bacterium]
MKKIALSITILFVLSYLYSCSSVTTVSGTWKKPATSAKRYNKIAVIGLSGDIVKRSAVENAIVSKLKADGINAVAGTTILPDTFVDNNDDGKVDDAKKEAIAAELEKQGVDGALTISLVNVKESEQYVPGSSFYTPYSGYYGFNNYYGGAYNMVNTPGYYVKNTNIFLASNFYDLTNNDALIWSAQTNTGNPTSINDLAQSYSTALVEDFLSAGVVRK